MANIPVTTRFIGIADSVDLTERKSAQINAETEPYTMQDIIDSVPVSSSGPLGGIYAIIQNFNNNPTLSSTNLDQLGLISMTRFDTGIYQMNFPANTFSASPLNTMIDIKDLRTYTIASGPEAGTVVSLIVAYISDDSTITVLTSDSSGNLADTIFNTTMYITVFN